MERFARDALAEAGVLGMSTLQLILLRLALAVLVVLGRDALVALARVKWPVPPPTWDPEAGTGPLSPAVPLDQVPEEPKP